VLQDLKKDFGLTARESISLQAVHSLGCARHNYVQSNKYVWFGSATDSTIGSDGTVKGLLSNIYYKYLNGEMYKRAGNGIGSRLERSYWVGDQLGRPVGGTGWSLHCHGAWNTSTPEAGPCDFRPTHTGCKQNENPESNMRIDCFDFVNGTFVRRPGDNCQDAELDLVRMVQTGGASVSWEELCKSEGWTFGLPYEVSFVVDFTVDSENRPRGCGALDHTPLVFGNENTHLPAGERYAIYPGSPGFDGSPACALNMYAPEGEASADIVAAFAEDHDLWAETFLEAWAKLQINGYNPKHLTEGPENSWLLARIKPHS